MENRKFTRFTVEQPDKKIVWETPYEDIGGEDCIYALETLMVGLTFSPYTVVRCMKDYVDEHSYLLENE